jgi:hypothetical protein
MEEHIENKNQESREKFIFLRPIRLLEPKLANKYLGKAGALYVASPPGAGQLMDSPCSIRAARSKNECPARSRAIH